MRNKLRRARCPGCCGRRVTRCCPRGRSRTRYSSTCRPSGHHRHGVAQQGPRGHSRSGRAAGRARLRRGPAPRRPDGPRPGRARRDLRPARRQGRHPRCSSRVATPTTAGGYPDALEPAGGPRRAGPALRPRRHHRLPRVAPQDHRRPDVQSMWDKRRHATHVVSNLSFDAGGRQHLGPPDAQARDHDAAAPRRTRPGRARQAARDGNEDRRRRVDAVPEQEQAHVRPAGGARRLHRRTVPGEVRPSLAAPEALVEGLHVFTFNQVAETGAGAATCSSALRAKLKRVASHAARRAASSSRPSPVGIDRQRQPSRSAAADASAELGRRRAPGPATPPACSGRSSRRAARASGPGRARAPRCVRRSGPGSR